MGGQNQSFSRPWNTLLRGYPRPGLTGYNFRKLHNMPNVTRWFIKVGIIYFLLGVSLAIVAELDVINTRALLLPVYWHMIVTGWITQVIMGVSIWMFPRKHRDNKKRESVLSWLAFWLLNSGLVLRFLSEPFLPIVQNHLAVTSLMLTSAVLQVLGVIFYVAEIWPRLQTREKQKHQRSLS